MSTLLSLKPENEKRLNPHALSRFNDWKAPILSKVPQLRLFNIEQIEADLNAYLDENETAELNKCLSDITRWLSGCTLFDESKRPGDPEVKALSIKGEMDSYRLPKNNFR